MNQDEVRDFWARRAADTSGSIRWTDERMLELDIALLGGLVGQGDSLLDLGCGTGDLFLGLLDRLSRVLAVDMMPEFLARIPAHPAVTTRLAGVEDLELDETFDVGAMFGVVTHLTQDQELGAYRTLRAAVPSGVVVVKNQCGRDADVEVDRWSEAFGQRYVGRYPSVAGHAARLGEHFAEVEVVPYPEAVNPWPDTQHVAFVCRAARPV